MGVAMVCIMSGCSTSGGACTARRALRRGALLSAVVTAAMLVFAVSALAVSGKPIVAGTPLSNEAPAVAVDSSGTAYIAWNDDKGVGGAPDFVQYCVIPAGASACSHTGNLMPADSAGYIDGVQVLADGGTVVILADVYGAAGGSGGDYEPEQEWQSTDGGATFNIVNGGLSVTDGILNADTGPLSAVIVPGTNVLGYGWNTAGGAPPTFNAFPLTSPGECSTVMCNGAPSNTGGAPPYPFAELAPASQPDQIGNAGGQFASQLGANPGVLGVFNTDFTNGNLGCSSAQTVPFGTAFAYASGAQSSTNDYNISPGSPNSAWKVPIAQLDCNVDYPAVGGGPSGFGVLEADQLTGNTIYHGFDQAHQDFDTPQVVVEKGINVFPALSQDGAGGIYATLCCSGSGAITLSYSASGGTTWTTGTLNPNTDGGAGNLNSSVDTAGQGWAVWTDNGSVYAQQFVKADAVAAAIGDSGSSNGKTITVDVTCSTLPCTITVTITKTETVVIKASAARKHKTRKETVTLAKGTFTITKGGAHKLGVRLTRAGDQALVAGHGHLKANVLLADKTQGGVQTITGTLKITTSRSKHRK